MNPTYERYLFRKRRQQPGESFETFVTDLKTILKVCEVPASFENELTRVLIIYGIMHNALRERLS